MQVAGMTNIGLERTRNEDSCFARADRDLALLAVADGMGGHQAGHVASRLAVGVAGEFWADLDHGASLPAEEVRLAINRLIRRANGAILAEAAKSYDRQGMGTTLTIGLLQGKNLTIGHVGDSRAYLISGKKIRLLTRDHSLLEQLIEAGDIKPEEAHNHPQRHILTRALGMSTALEVDLVELEIEKGSRLLFCTDGLTGLVRDDEILSRCLEERDPQKLARSLIDLANERGGYDNITVVIATGIGGQQA